MRHIQCSKSGCDDNARFIHRHISVAICQGHEKEAGPMLARFEREHELAEFEVDIIMARLHAGWADAQQAKVLSDEARKKKVELLDLGAKQIAEFQAWLGEPIPEDSSRAALIAEVDRLAKEISKRDAFTQEKLAGLKLVAETCKGMLAASPAEPPSEARKALTDILAVIQAIIDVLDALPTEARST